MAWEVDGMQAPVFLQPLGENWGAEGAEGGGGRERVGGKGRRGRGVYSSANESKLTVKKGTLSKTGSKATSEFDLMV